MLVSFSITLGNESRLERCIVETRSGNVTYIIYITISPKIIFLSIRPFPCVRKEQVYLRIMRPEAGCGQPKYSGIGGRLLPSESRLTGRAGVGQLTPDATCGLP